MTTLGYTLDSIRARINEPQEVAWTDVDLRRWVNEITSDIARTTESLRAQESFACVVGTAAYTPTFTLTPHRIYRVEFIPSGESTTYPLEFRDPNAMDEIWGTLQSTEGTPMCWTSWGYPPALTIQVFPAPSRAGTIKCWFYRRAAQLELDGTDDAVEVDIPAGWDDILVDGVEYKALRRDSDPRWQEAKQEYEQHREALAETSLRFTDAQPIITNAQGGMIPGWLYGSEWD